MQKNTQLTSATAAASIACARPRYADSDAPSVKRRARQLQGLLHQGRDRASRKVDLDNFQIGWTQTWTPVFATQLVLYGALQHGFLDNPYRCVVIAPAGDQALENHPDNRLRLRIGVRAKYYVRPLRIAFSAGGRALPRYLGHPRPNLRARSRALCVGPICA